MTFCLLSFTVLWACEKGKSEKQSNKETNKNFVEYMPNVQFVPIDTGKFEQTVRAPAQLKSSQRLKIKNEISGELLQVNIGNVERVEKNDILFRFDDNKLKLDYQLAKVEYERIKQEHDIENRLRNGDSLQGDTNLLESFTGLKEAKLNLEKAKILLEETLVRAPFDGIVVFDEIPQEGAFLSAGSVLAELINPHKQFLEIDILDVYTHMIEANQPVRIDNFPDISSEITNVKPLNSNASNTFKAYAKIKNGHIPKPIGSKFWVQIVYNSTRGEYRVPNTAVLERNGRPLVFRLNKDKVEWIWLQSYSENDSHAILESSRLQVGDTVAVDGHYSLSHKQKVTSQVIGDYGY